MTEEQISKRELLKKTAYIAPAVLTLKAIPSFASNGSVEKGNNGVGNGEDPQPPGNPPLNDGPGSGPGNPGGQLTQRQRQFRGLRAKP
jgi:hypothetical protein